MEILVTKEHILAAEKECKNKVLTSACAVHQALRPFIAGKFTVISNKAYAYTPDGEQRKEFHFETDLPVELYAGDFQGSLKMIERNGPYKINVAGL